MRAYPSCGSRAIARRALAWLSLQRLRPSSISARRAQCDRVGGIERDSRGDLRERSRKITVGLEHVRHRDECRRRRRSGAYSGTCAIARRREVVPPECCDRLQRERVGVARSQPQRGSDVRVRGFELAAAEPRRGARRVKRCVVDFGRSWFLLRSGQICGENLGEVRGPAHQLDRLEDGAHDRFLAVARLRHEIARYFDPPHRIRHDDGAFEYRDLGLALFVVHSDVEFSAFETRVRIRCRELQRARVAADDVDHAANEIDQRADSIVRRPERQHGALVEPNGGLIPQANHHATEGLHSHGIAEAKYLALRRPSPRITASALHFHDALDRDELRAPIVAGEGQRRLSYSTAGREGQQRDAARGRHGDVAWAGDARAVGFGLGRWRAGHQRPLLFGPEPG